MVKLFLASVLHLLDKISNEDTDVFVISAISKLCPYFAAFPKMNRALLKTMLHRWSHAAESVRVSAFLTIRTSAMVSPHPFIDLVLKGSYLTFIRNCKFPSPVVRPTLTFMLNCGEFFFSAAAFTYANMYARGTVALQSKIVPC